MDKYIGRLLDNRYEILEVIGSGGMAVVYKARCHRLNRLVAIKILKDEYMEDEDFRRRFHSESQAVAMLSHPNIVSVYDVSTSIMADYIVMELVEGISLKQYMEKKGTVNWKETLHFAIQIGKALEHAHSRGIVHRDIKPHNVMVLKNGSVKVMDFGIARMMSKGNTLTKEALGSVHYISPEQAKGGRVDNRSDLYSLGVVMYEMMTGRPPYDGESPVAVAIQHINGGAAMPSTLNPNIPGGLEQIIMKAMSVDPAARYSSAAQMLRDMDEFRKDPAMLFNYQTEGVDVIHVHKSESGQEAAVASGAKTTAERVVEKKEGPSPEQNRQRMQRRAEEQRRREAEAAKKRNNIAIIAITACSLVIVIAVVILLVIMLGKSDASEKVQVPNLVGKYYDSLDLDKYQNFTLKLSNQEVYSTEYEPGEIMDQDPKANTMVEPGSVIEIVVCQGIGSTTADDTTEPEESTSPELLMVALVNRTEQEAREILAKLDLDLDVNTQKAFSEDIMADRVVASDPKVGEPLYEGQTVILTVSRGRQPKMEDMTGKTADQVRDILMNYDLDLVIHSETEYSEDVEEGQVIRTEPKSGVLLDVGDEVTLVISNGKEIIKKVIPNVNGMAVDKAVNIIKGEGFASYEFERVDSAEEKDVVIGFYVKDLPDQDLSEAVDVTNTIVLQVSTGVAPETTRTVPIAIPTEAELQEFLEESEYKNSDGNISFTITVTMGGKVYGTFENLNFESKALSLELTGSGVQTCEILINGKDFRQISVDFTV